MGSGLTAMVAPTPTRREMRRMRSARLLAEAGMADGRATDTGTDDMLTTDTRLTETEASSKQQKLMYEVERRRRQRQN